MLRHQSNSRSFWVQQHLFLSWASATTILQNLSWPLHISAEALWENPKQNKIHVHLQKIQNTSTGQDWAFSLWRFSECLWFKGQLLVNLELTARKEKSLFKYKPLIIPLKAPLFSWKLMAWVTVQFPGNSYTDIMHTLNALQIALDKCIWRTNKYKWGGV